MSDTSKAVERILGHQRIFQSVFNDLDMRHEIVTLEDGKKTYAYVYDGVDPYELEDKAFPGTLAAINAHLEAVKQQSREDGARHFKDYILDDAGPFTANASIRVAFSHWKKYNLSHPTQDNTSE